MDDIQILIQDAAQRILPTLTPDQLRQRLARRSTPTLQRPPRAWCLAVRASDTRINPYHAAIVPEDATNPKDLDHPGRVLPHTVTLDQRLLQKLCRPVEVEHGTTLKKLTRLLGCTPASLKSRRLNNVFLTEFRRCARGTIYGNVFPIFSTDRPLDPAATLFALPDPAWTWTATSLVSRIPDGFAQDLTRIPVYRPRTTHFDKPDPTHPEHPANDPVLPRASRRLPRPPPDPVWYKWKGDVYLGYDWRNPYAKANYERRQRRLELCRAAQRRRRKLHPRSNPSGSLHFWGWRWLCPGCNKPAEVLYLPLRPVSLLDQRLLRSTLKRLAQPLADFARPHDWYARTFACMRCHKITLLSRAQHNAWNHFIAYLTGGLLYGHEVPRPAHFSTRKRPYRPHIVQAPRRQQVLRRLLNGWTLQQIRRDLALSRQALENHIRALCRHENVNNRQELAQKLNSPHPQPLTQRQRAEKRRQQVLPLLLEGRTNQQIAQALSLHAHIVQHDVQTLHREHAITGSRRQRRQRLAQKLNHPLPPHT